MGHLVALGEQSVQLVSSKRATNLNHLASINFALGGIALNFSILAHQFLHLQCLMILLH
jgi:hypothetical protein